MIKTDCLHFPLDRPCLFNKRSGARCAGCRHYLPVLNRRKGTPKKILIVKLGAMGDVLRTTFLLPGLQKKYPRCQITWLVADGSESLLAGNPAIAEIWTP